MAQEKPIHKFYNQVYRDLQLTSVTNAEKIILSWALGEEFGLQNCISLSLRSIHHPTFCWFHSVVQVTSGLTCVTERRVCVCVCMCVYCSEEFGTSQR